MHIIENIFLLQMKKKTAITPTREEDYSQWYQEVIKASDLAEHSVVRGCMVIKPWGYSLWEGIQKELDGKIKETGHQNFYFPMFIPLSLMEKEAKHVDGFAKECAVVTHHRLEVAESGKLVPCSPLEEPLIVRPTSEVLIGESFSKWIKSYRDLPLLANQWANVVRWEMRTRLFLRTTEFLWQEGHTAHATANEAVEEAEKMLEVYRSLMEDFMAMPVILGRKTDSEKFPGADTTYCLEAMMQDKKALQAGTSHFLGQHFSKAFDIKYLSSLGTEEYAWTTSWGVTTRLIGGLIMMHGDDDGLVLPPKIAPIQIVIIPLVHKEEDRSKVLEYCSVLKESLKEKRYNDSKIRVEVDNKEKSTGDKIWGWVKKGVPVRVEVGMREIEAGNVCIARRDMKHNEKQIMPLEQFIASAENTLDEIHNNIFLNAKKFQDDNTFFAESKEEFYKFFKDESSAFVLAHWAGDSATEDMIKKDIKVTARCIPLKYSGKLGKCIFTNKEDAPLILFSKAY